MLVRIGQKAINSRTQIAMVSTTGNVRDVSGVPSNGVDFAPSGSARVSIIIVILPSPVRAQIIVGQHGSEQGPAVLLDALIGLHGAFPVGNAGAQHRSEEHTSEL